MSECLVRLCAFEDQDSGEGLALNTRKFPGQFCLSFSTRELILTLENDDEMPINIQNSVKKLPKKIQLILCSYKTVQLSKKVLAFHRSSSRHQECLEDGMFLGESFGICFETTDDLKTFQNELELVLQTSANIEEPPSKKRKPHENSSPLASDFDSRTEQGSATQYFQFYGSLFQQQNMLQDYTRTATYQRAIHENWGDFRDKVVLDVGAGTGILSFFAAQAGAKRVYAVEASSMAAHCKALVSANDMDGVISVLAAKIEEVQLPELVDVIVSEPMGYMLVNERMLESFIYARKFLRKGGRMFPSKADLHFALFSDDALHQEQQQRGAFWSQQAFHGVALGSLQQPALDELFKQPVVDAWSAAILVSPTVRWTIDFERDPAERLHRIHVPFTLTAQRTCHVHGLAIWFDVAFVGGSRTVWLSTAPTEPLTHWYQVRCLLKRPILAIAGQNIVGSLVMTANDKQSYDLEMDMEIEGSGKRQHNTLDLKTPHFRYTGQPVTAPPGQQTECPSDQLNQTLMLGGNVLVDQLQQQQQQNGEITAKLLPNQTQLQFLPDQLPKGHMGNPEQQLLCNNYWPAK